MVSSTQTAIETIQRLETHVADLEHDLATVKARLIAADGEVTREQEANRKLALERDHFRDFAVELATRVDVILESCHAAKTAAEMAPFKPSAVRTVKTPVDADEMLKKLATSLAPDAEPEELPEPAER